MLNYTDVICILLNSTCSQTRARWDTPAIDTVLVRNAVFPEQPKLFCHYIRPPCPDYRPRLPLPLLCTRPTPFCASSFDHPRRMCFCTFPLAVFGSSSATPSSPTNHTHAGAFWTPPEPNRSAETGLHSPTAGPVGRPRLASTHLRVHPGRNGAADLLPRERGVRLAHDPRADDLAELRVGHGDSRRLPYGGVRSQHVLDLHREQVLQGHIGVRTRACLVLGACGATRLSAADDDVLDSADDWRGTAMSALLLGTISEVNLSLTL